MMRPLFAAVAGLVLAAAAAAQDESARYEILHNPDLYRQDTPQETLRSVLGAVARDRYDYLAAHLLDPDWVDARLAVHQPYYERIGGEQVVSSPGGAVLRPAELNARVKEVGTRLNFRHFAGVIRTKLADDPNHLKDLRRFLRDADFQVAGDTATAKHKDVKDRALYFKKVKDRWYLENRTDEAAAPPPPKE